MKDFLQGMVDAVESGGADEEMDEEESAKSEGSHIYHAGRKKIPITEDELIGQVSLSLTYNRTLNRRKVPL